MKSKGATVINYAVINTAGLKRITRFESEERIESDHQPICVTLQCPQSQDREKREKSGK